ncbi:hypothetical protein DICSQDRAFT_153076 [Dichomitus squalens LYAD-421 SS1]|uniref:uncharacterized protein n=1 Tax=Dichomitus squalens (strain LYAD-421) TaxID=732165 RepID=UPI000441474A|nr:uncharacterized protein DICSQDRAFT_153076 [Dichomitus squalens LYAD-421 SS1]EJF64898.1 hypothetical protein DICSQDRAFT_153076 [Dichomitus squalens LYAD-421 SS1]
MHERCPAAVPALSLVMPHPSLPRRRSSMLSSVSDPHTPPPRNSPLPVLSPASNRKSSDSWNSSNYDGADDLEWEWKPEQTRLLSRTLDALPSHLITPFNGPVPPSNLLDKIARGVVHAKGPAEWPHSLRATRAKIVELARLRGKEDTASDTIAEEESTDPGSVQQKPSRGFKRPLHKQSSMDFVPTAAQLDPSDDAIARLSYRLQHTERMIPNPAYHPYARTSPRLRTMGSTASSTTLNSQSSCSSGSKIPRLRRSLSSISNSSDSYIQNPGVDPRVQRIRRTESFAGSALYPPGSPLKCAPSFGSISKRSSDAMSVDFSNRSDVTTSDEEEKLRSKKAKKPRVKACSPTPPATSPPAVSPAKTKQLRRTTKHISKPSSVAAPTDSSRRTSRPKMTLSRNPSILGPELPQPPPARPEHPTPIVKPRSHRKSPSSLSPPSTIPTPSPPSPSRKTPRRTKAPSSARAIVGRKISFGNMMATHEEENVSLGAGLGLGSAFQLD